MVTKEYWIERLNLQQHPEGGYFREIYRSAGTISQNCLPDEYEGNRNYATSIYFLLGHEDISAFHRLASDEIWYYHSGEPLNIYILDKQGNIETRKLGPNPDEDEEFQVIIQAGSIFGAKVNSGKDYTLMGCVVAPGFDFVDFELMKCKELLELFPQHEEIIKLLTK